VTRYQNLKGRAVFFLSFLSFLWFINFAGRACFGPTLPVLEDEFAVTHSQASSIITLIFTGYACALFFSGALSRVLGHKRTLVVSFLVLAAVFLSIPLVKTFRMLHLLGFVLGMCCGLYLPNILPIITDYYDEKIWGRVISIHDSGASLAIFLSPFLVLFFLSIASWRIMFFVFGAVFLVFGTLFSRFVEDPRIKGKRVGFQLALFRKPSLWLMGIVWILASGANVGLYFIIPLYLVKELGLEIGQATSLFGLSRLGGVIVSIGAGFFVDRFNLKKTALGLLFGGGVFTVLLTSTVDSRWINGLLFMQTSMVQGFVPVSLVWISRIFNSEERGQATGFIVSFAAVFGVGLIPYLLGVCGDHFSFRVGILVLGLLTVVSCGLLIPVKDSQA
jgi:MFS transporter, NNP family, nitrate/nitrite transporter